MGNPYEELRQFDNAWQQAQSQENTPLPDGKYTGAVTECVLKKTKPQGEGVYPELIIKMELTVTEPHEQQNRKAWLTFFLERDPSLGILKGVVAKLDESIAQCGSLETVVEYFITMMQGRIVEFQKKTTLDKHGKTGPDGKPKQYENIYINKIHPMGEANEYGELPF